LRNNVALWIKLVSQIQTSLDPHIFPPLCSCGMTGRTTLNEHLWPLECVPRLLEHRYLVWEHVFLEFLTWLITFFHCSWLLSNGKQLSLHREKRPCNNGFPLGWCDHSSLLEREPKNWYGEHIGICMPKTNKIQPVLTQCSQASK
jgi:hypothetical protein